MHESEPVSRFQPGPPSILGTRNQTARFLKGTNNRRKKTVRRPQLFYFSLSLSLSLFRAPVAEDDPLLAPFKVKALAPQQGLQLPFAPPRLRLRFRVRLVRRLRRRVGRRMRGFVVGVVLHPEPVVHRMAPETRHLECLEEQSPAILSSGGFWDTPNQLQDRGFSYSNCFLDTSNGFGLGRGGSIWS